MSVVTAVKYLAEFAAEALKPWDPSREKAAVMLADLPLMVRLREDDDATADEVTFLVLGRFDKAEVPAIEGADWLRLRRFVDKAGDQWQEEPDAFALVMWKGMAVEVDEDSPRYSLEELEREFGPLVEVVPQPTAEADLWRVQPSDGRSTAEKREDVRGGAS